MKSVKEFCMRKSGRSNTIDAQFLGRAVQAIWERNERRVKLGKVSRVVQINGVLHVDANILLSDLELVLSQAVLSKMKLIFTGDQPLSHPNENDLVKDMLKSAKQLFQVS